MDGALTHIFILGSKGKSLTLERLRALNSSVIEAQRFINLSRMEYKNKFVLKIEVTYLKLKKSNESETDQRFCVDQFSRESKPNLSRKKAYF